MRILSLCLVIQRCLRVILLGFCLRVIVNVKPIHFERRHLVFYLYCYLYIHLIRNRFLIKKNLIRL